MNNWTAPETVILRENDLTDEVWDILAEDDDVCALSHIIARRFNFYEEGAHSWRPKNSQDLFLIFGLASRDAPAVKIRVINWKPLNPLDFVPSDVQSGERQETSDEHSATLEKARFASEQEFSLRFSEGLPIVIQRLRWTALQEL